jgi:hypothetical protein
MGRRESAQTWEGLGRHRFRPAREQRTPRAMGRPNQHLLTMPRRIKDTSNKKKRTTKGMAWPPIIARGEGGEQSEQG